MTSSRRAVLLGAIAVAAPATSPAQHGHGAHAPSDGGFAAGMHRSMDDMIRAMAAPMSGDPDRDFLAMMIPHHQGAVAMARLALVHCRDPLIRQLAEEIIASQQAEIASMQGRLRALESSGADQEFPAVRGTRGP